MGPWINEIPAFGSILNWPQQPTNTRICSTSLCYCDRTDRGPGVSLVSDWIRPWPEGLRLVRIALPLPSEPRRMGLIWPRVSQRLHISAHRGRRFRLNVDAISA
ncbi:DNA-binding transcriptional LysR family regulator [Variovorax sp. GrIS 2.14]|uniref:hypothetical protein n=1 Tax=Variovorax sp. GrIS 2.14 TaxID=3071709 RepID=UPI0038F73708